MTYVAEKNDKKPTVDQILTNDFVGSVKLSDSEWSAAEKRFEPYRKYVG
jgi:hypothetical protein